MQNIMIDLTHKYINSEILIDYTFKLKDKCDKLTF